MEHNTRSYNHWSPFKVYAHYRWVLSALLFSAYLFGRQHNGGEGYSNTTLYLIAAIGFFALSNFTIARLYFQRNPSTQSMFRTITLDLGLITLLAHASGGVTQNFSMLMVVSVAAGGIVLAGKKSLGVAATAACLILVEQFVFRGGNRQDYIQLGLLGVAFFATSLLARNIAQRLGEAETQASVATAHLADLKNLNQMIIQRMQTGILVINQKQEVQMINTSACRLLGIESPLCPVPLKQLSSVLNTQTRYWIHHQEPTKPFRNHHTLPEIKASLARTQEKNQENILIFLDDYGRLTQQAQLLKLKSLARLTASIAHEIRNPLGAISHAAQLLSESQQNTSDMRLTEIIQEHSGRVNTIIENVLQLSRRQSPKLERITLSVWLEKFIADFTLHHLTPCKIELITPPMHDLHVHFDPSQLTQVLNNLCENGLRYNQRQTGQARVKLHCGTTADELPFLEIKDEGPGVSTEQRELLFEPFYTSESGGTGLGLFLAKELCEINHATLAYIPSDLGPSDSGCCFRITFAHPKRILT